VTQERILVCESEGAIALDLQKSLQEMGYPVPSVTSTGEEAVAAARSMKPTLVIIEIQLKGTLDGIQAARLIKQWGEVPVVYLSTIFDKRIFDLARSTHPCGYLMKPFSESQLEATIALALSDHKTAASLDCRELPEANCSSPAQVNNSHQILEDRNLVPICSSCKRVREASGSWSPVEDYLTEYFGIRFTHGLCPECLKVFRQH
jgi:two-component system, response regulator PdtaR